MSFGISLNGHNADLDKVKEAFERTVRDLREAGAQDLNGSAWGGEGGQTLSISVDQVDAEPTAAAAADEPAGEDDGSSVDHNEGE